MEKGKLRLVGGVLLILLLLLAACAPAAPPATSEPESTAPPASKPTATPPPVLEPPPPDQKPKETPRPVYVPPPPPDVAPLTVQIKGELPGGNQRAIERFNRIYPYLVKYLGKPFSIGTQDVTWSYIADTTEWGWLAKTNSVVLGSNILQQNPETAPYSKLDESYEHETAHLFYDIGDEAMMFDFGQWIWEAHALAGQSLANSEFAGVPYFDGVAISYGTKANLGWEVVNGVTRDGDKWNRTIVDSSATQSLLLLSEVLSYDSELDFLKRVNAEILAWHLATGNTRISAEQYRSFLNAAAQGRTIDGQLPGDWLFSQPVANIAGALGSYLAVVPMYSLAPNSAMETWPTRFWVFAFQREMPGNDRRESNFSGFDVTLTVFDSAGKQVGKTSTTVDGPMGIELSSNTLIKPELPAGAYLVKAEAEIDGDKLTADNYFVIMTRFPGITANDNRLIVVPMNADGSALRPEVVATLKVSGGTVSQRLPGMMVITAAPGASIEFKLGNFNAVISKPVTARVACLRIP